MAPKKRRAKQAPARAPKPPELRAARKLDATALELIARVEDPDVSVSGEGLARIAIAIAEATVESEDRNWDALREVVVRLHSLASTVTAEVTTAGEMRESSIAHQDLREIAHQLAHATDPRSALALRWTAGVVAGAGSLSIDEPSDAEAAGYVAATLQQGADDRLAAFAEQHERAIIDIIAGPFGLVLTAPMLEALPLSATPMALEALESREAPFLGAYSSLLRYADRLNTTIEDLDEVVPPFHTDPVIAGAMQRFTRWLQGIKRGPLLPASFDDRFDPRVYEDRTSAFALDSAREALSCSLFEDTVLYLDFVGDVPEHQRYRRLVELLQQTRLGSAGYPLGIEDSQGRSGLADRIAPKLQDIQSLLEDLASRVLHHGEVDALVLSEVALVRALHAACTDAAEEARGYFELAVDFSDGGLSASAAWLYATTFFVAEADGRAVERSSEQRDYAMGLIQHALAAGFTPDREELDRFAVLLGSEPAKMRAALDHLASKARVLGEEGTERHDGAPLMHEIENVVCDVTGSELSDDVNQLFRELLSGSGYVSHAEPHFTLGEVHDGAIEPWIAYDHVARALRQGQEKRRHRGITDVVRRINQEVQTEAERSVAIEEDRRHRREERRRRRRRVATAAEAEESSAAGIDEANLPDRPNEPWLMEVIDEIAEEHDENLALVVADHLEVHPSDALDRRWERACRPGGELRGVLGDVLADRERLRSLRRRGDLEEAKAIAFSLFHQTIDRDGELAAGVLGMLEDLGCSEEEIEPLHRAVTEMLSPSEEGVRADSKSGLVLPDRDICILFVGGNEKQSQYHAAIEDDLERDYGGRVVVSWHTTGWSANWEPIARRVKSAYDHADAVVLMQLVRTGLGARIRATSNEAGVPRIACTGHGKASIRRSIDDAVRVAIEQDRGAVKT